MIFQQKTIHWRTTLQAAYFDTKEWLEAYQHRDIDTRRQQQRSNMENQQSKWTRPPTSFLKCNYDGAYNRMQPTTTAGWLIRDEMGIFKGAAHASNQQPTSALEGELQALLLAMMHCWSKGYQHIIFEGDNINVMKLVKGEATNIDVINWIRDIRRWAAKFQEVRFTWANRNSNTCADILAKKTIPGSVSFYYYSCVPNFLHNALSNDYFD